MARVPGVILITCNMGAHNLPDIYPSGFGHTYQANPSRPCYNYYIATVHHFVTEINVATHEQFLSTSCNWIVERFTIIHSFYEFLFK